MRAQAASATLKLVVGFSNFIRISFVFAVLVSCLHGVYGNTIISSLSRSRSMLVLDNVVCVEVAAAHCL